MKALFSVERFILRQSSTWAIALIAVSYVVAPDAVAGQPTEIPIATLVKEKFKCTDSEVLCIDSCTGSVVATRNGASATFLVDQGTTIRVRVVGACVAEKHTKFSTTVSYRTSLDSLNKSKIAEPTTTPSVPGPSAPPAAGAPPQDPLDIDKTQLNSFVDLKEKAHVATVEAEEANADPRAASDGVQADLAKEKEARSKKLKEAVETARQQAEALHLVYESSETLIGSDNAAFAILTVERTPTGTPTGTSTACTPPTCAEDWHSAHATFMLRHGRYYLDFSVGAVIVMKGTQTIAGIPYRGNQSDLRLSTEISSPINAIFAAVLYPAGRSRDVLGLWDVKTRRDFFGLFSLQLGTELSRDTALRSVYVGGAFDVVSGVSVVAGGAFVPVSFYRSGAQDGMAVQSASDVASLTRQPNVFRFFFGFSASTEVFKLAQKAANGI